MKAAFQSAAASADIEAALGFYLLDAPHMAEKFIAALEKSTRQIERQPGMGSPRYALVLNLPGLRHRRLSRFPYALFYIEHTGHLDVIRLVHLSRDIPATLQAD